MTYRRSTYRNDFDDRVNGLLKKARNAQRLNEDHLDLRESVFQCSVILVVAAMETYLKLLIESWIQNIKSNNLGHSAPLDARAFVVAQKLERQFALFQYDGDERALYQSLMTKSELWNLLHGSSNLPQFFEGKTLHSGAAYPSAKNLKKLFGRIGIGDIMAQLGRLLSRDVEVLIDGFQSIRTALAHSSPPPITIADVERLLTDCKSLVGAVDRVLYLHVMKHGGAQCWTV
jgi:hypothetical protein